MTEKEKLLEKITKMKTLIAKGEKLQSQGYDCRVLNKINKAKLKELESKLLEIEQSKGGGD